MSERERSRPHASEPGLSRPQPASAADPALYSPYRIEARMAELQFLAEASRDLNSSLKLNDVFQQIARRVCDLVDCHLFSVILWNEDEQVLQHAYTLKLGEQIEPADRWPMGRGLTGTAAALQRSVRVAECAKDPRYVSFPHAEFGIRSELAIPLVLQGRLIGVLDLQSKEPDLFTVRHEQMLMALASHMATALENARLYERLLAQEERVRRALDTARAIQKGLFPDEAPLLAGFDFGVAFAPARTLAGDFYDFLPYGDGKIALALGDVAGKGYGAALYGSLAVGIMRGHVVAHAFSPAEMMAHLHEHLSQVHAENRFLAMIYCLLDPVSRSLTLASSGLPHPYLYRAGEAGRVAVSGLPLGLFPDIEHRYEEVQLALKHGEVLVLCSDGLEDCLYEQGQKFGDRVVDKWLERLAARTAQKIADELIRVSEPSAKGRQEAMDDRTVLVIKATDQQWQGPGGI